MNTSIFPRMHVSYHVRDIKATVDFYTKFFEVEPVKLKDDYAKYILTEPSLNISFIKSDVQVANRTMHFGIETNDPSDLKRRLGNAMHHELAIDEEKNVNCCYAKQDKFWVTDPDGYRWEVFQFLENVEANDKKYQADKVCCN